MKKRAAVSCRRARGGGWGAYLVSSQRQIIGIIHEGIFQVSCHLIQGPVALDTDEVDDQPDPGAVDKCNHQ